MAPTANTLARATPGWPLRSSGARHALSRGRIGGFCASSTETLKNPYSFSTRLEG
jgi:hypothetical protein